MGAVAYVAAVLLATARPGPRAWALHLPGFLPAGPRLIVLALLVLGALAVLAGALRSAPGPRVAKQKSPGAVRGGDGTRRQARPGRGARSLAGRALPLLVLPLGLLYWLLRTRTHFLGDGVVWLSGLRAGTELAESEPLAKALWLGFAALLRALSAPIDPWTVAIFPAALGALAAPVLWGIAGHCTPGARSRPIAFAVLLTLGVAQLFFGYIESYPPTALAILLYLWLALRRLRGRGSPILLAASLGAAIACHLSALYLLPSYLYLVAREPGPLAKRAALAAIAPAVAALLLLALGSEPSEWTRALGIAAHAARSAGGAGRLEKPYPALSQDHAVDLLNAILLVLPIPAMLLGARLPALVRIARPGAVPVAADVAFLATAAGSGLLLAILLVLPVPPAQDWDLISLLLLSAAVLGLRAGRSLYGPESRRSTRYGLVGLGLGALLSFVLVNADARAGIRRFRTILAPGAKITSFGRAYGHGILAEYYEDLENHAASLADAREALAAEPTNPRYWLKVGTALYKLNRYEEAIPVLEESLRRGPQSGATRHNLGLCYMRSGRFRDALALFREAVAIDPDRPDWRHNLGVAYVNVGEPDSAYVAWRDLLARWPGYPKTVRSMQKHFGAEAAPSAPGTIP